MSHANTDTTNNEVWYFFFIRNKKHNKTPNSQLIPVPG